MTKSLVAHETSGVLPVGPPKDLKAALKLHIWRLLHADDPESIAFRERLHGRPPIAVASTSSSQPFAGLSERRMRLPEVLKKTGLVTSTLYRYMDKGTFPRPYELGPGTVGWSPSEVDEWLRTRKKRNPSPRRKAKASV